MTACADFWLDLHRIADQFRGTDDDGEQRLQTLASELDSMPPAARQALLAHLDDALRSLTELQSRCALRH